ncbi:MAG TPA: PKD domain-containing protein [Chloroflexi bacterium]|nr:PKD domain-containing protein [Chloroflexota bacterium]
MNANWDGDLSGADNPETITMDSDKVVTATFTASCVHVAGADFTAVETSPLVVRFSGTVIVGSPPITYTWDFGDGSVGSGQIVTHTYALSSTLTYSVTMTATNACPSQETVEKSITLRSPTIYLPLVMRNG